MYCKYNIFLLNQHSEVLFQVQLTAKCQMSNKTCQNVKFVVKIKNYFLQSNSTFSDIGFKCKMQVYMNRDWRPTVYQVFKVVL